MSERHSILFLVDEIMAAGLPTRTRRLIERLARDLDVVLVAQCYLKPGHRARRLSAPCEVYGFSPDHFDADVTAFAGTIAARHRPRWVVAYGWENPQLVAALDALDLPILLVLDSVERGPHAEIQIVKVFRHVTKIVFGDRSVLESLTSARWALDARDFRVLDAPVLDAPVSDGAARPRSTPWLARLYRALRRVPPPSPAEESRVARKAAVIREAGERCVRSEAQARDNRVRDAAAIVASGLFDPDLFLPPHALPPVTPTIEAYLRTSQLAVPRDRPLAGRLQRRPLAGFHPLIYASDNPHFDEASGEDPLAHFIRAGRPPGRWCHRVLSSRDETTQTSVPAAIHGHFHYPDLLPEFLDRLAVNRCEPDLFLTTTSPERRDAIAHALDAAHVAPKSLTVCLNRGRDIWPFIDLLQQGAFEPYAAVGHVHAKRSPHYTEGQLWRDFLWSHLVGSRDAMMDAILAAFAADPRLGMIFPEDPYLTGWEDNFGPATELAARAGLPLPLPNHFEYPVGTMFWARPAALDNLRNLGLTVDQMPEEPLPEDGTILHALERLLPFLAAHAGFTCATTRVPGSRR